MRKFTFLCLLMPFLVSNVFAWKLGDPIKDTSKVKKSEKPEETTKKKDDETGFSFSGYVDAYYSYNFNNPYSDGNDGRIFDVRHDNMSLGLVQTAIGYKSEKSEVFLDLGFGPNAELGNFGNTIGFGDGTGSSSLSIKQAYFAYNFSDKVKLTVGQYGTHVGYELIDAPLNFNYSLSYLFGNGPFYHTGAKFDFSLSDNFGFMLGVVNGWDALVDYNDKKSIAAQVYFAPVEQWNVYLNYLGGDEYDPREAGAAGNSYFGSYSGSMTNIFDLTTTFQASEKFLIGVNAALGLYATGAKEEDANDPYTKDATWGGAALYLNYAASEKFGIGLRSEYFEDYSGIRYPATPGFQALAFTLTGDVKLDGGRFNIKPELRLDTNKTEFFTPSGTDGASKKSMFTAGLAFVYSFGK